MREKIEVMKKRKVFSYLLRPIMVIAVLIGAALHIISQLELNKSFNRKIAFTPCKKIQRKR